MVELEVVKEIVGDVLQIGDRASSFDTGTRLLGAVPEFDSMAVVSVLTAIEDRFGIVVEDDEVDAQTFETLGTLHEFVVAKVGE